MRDDLSFSESSELLDHFGSYEPIPRLHEIERPKVAQASEWDHIQNLDVFFFRIYKYYEEKGLYCILASRILNIATLGFTIVFSGFLLLYVDWEAIQEGCPVEDECDFAELAIYSAPLRHRSGFRNGLVIVYLIIFTLYWIWNIVHLVLEIRPLMEIHRFCCIKLGLTLRELQTMAWSELVSRVVAAQSTMNLCVVKELSALDIVSRVMRKENYLIAMLNKDILNLEIPLPGFRRHVMLTKTLEWNIYRCILDCMFDDNFLIRREFLEDEVGLRKRLLLMSAVNLIVSPFLTVFLLVYFFLGNAEKIYHHPSSVGTRGWSALAKWKLREFNELPHIVNHRLNNAYTYAIKYLEQFPSPIVSMVGKFASFIVGAFAAALIGLALVDERLLEASLWGRKLVWYGAIATAALAVSRGMVTEEHAAFNPGDVMDKVVKYTHYLPRHWRNRCHHQDVQKEFESLLQYKAVMFLEEMLSIFVTPFILWYSLPSCAGQILEFVRDFTVNIEGVGDVCRLSVFDFEQHGNGKYAAPFHCAKDRRSSQGKMEKSFLSFCAVYPDWEPSASGRQMLHNISTHRASVSQTLTRSAFPVQQDLPGMYAASSSRHATPGQGPASTQFMASLHMSSHLSPTTTGSQLLPAEVTCELEQQINQLALQEFYKDQDTPQAPGPSLGDPLGPSLGDPSGPSLGGPWAAHREDFPAGRRPGVERGYVAPPACIPEPHPLHETGPQEMLGQAQQASASPERVFEPPTDDSDLDFPDNPPFSAGVASPPFSAGAVRPPFASDPLDDDDRSLL